MLLAGLCAWAFGNALALAFPDGMQVFPPADRNAPPHLSDAFHTGMAIGWFFSALTLLLAAFTIYLLNRLKTTILKPLPVPLLLAALSCLALLLLAVKLAA